MCTALSDVILENNNFYFFVFVFLIAYITSCHTYSHSVFWFDMLEAFKLKNHFSSRLFWSYPESISTAAAYNRDSFRIFAIYAELGIFNSISQLASYAKFFLAVST